MIKSIFAMVEAGRLDQETALALIQRAEAHARGGRPGFRQTFSFEQPYLRDHTVFGERLLLGVTYGSLAIEAFAQMYGADLLSGVGHLTLLSPLHLQAGETAEVTLAFLDRTEAAFTCDFAIAGPGGVRQGQAAKGVVLLGPPGPKPPPLALDDIRRAATSRQAGAEIYRRIRDVAYGPSLRTVQEVHSSGARSLARLVVQRALLDETRPYRVHPALLDGALLSALSATLFDGQPDTYIPFFMERLLCFDALGDEVWACGEITKRTDELVVCDLTFTHPDGAVAATVKGFTSKRVRDVPTLMASIRSAQRTPGASQERPPVRPQPPAHQPSANHPALEGKVTHYLERLLVQALGDGPSTLDRKMNFMDLGLESNRLVQISATLEQEIGIELFPTVFFEHQNLAEMTRYLVTEHAASFARHFGLEPVAVVPEAAADDRPPESRPVAAVAAIDRPAARDDIAVIGMAGIFAGSPDLSAFWRHLDSQRDLMAEIPRDRFDYRPWFDPSGNDPEKLYCKWGSFIDGVDRFDAPFFNMSRREAEIMDPQLRHLLQVIYWTAEDAGKINQLRGSRTGVYVGACFYDYQAAMIDDAKPVEVFDGIGNSPTMLSNRPSFYFDLKGPSLTVDTACSSSLIAAHLARKALLAGECDMAFVAGANLLLSPRHYQYFCRLKALGRSGRCHSFDAAADGYIPGEGIGAVMLKRLTAALSDGDQIHGVIKGSAIGHGGYSSTITAPSVSGEEQVILDAWNDAGIDPRTIGYIEAHGTGTSLGDPIEFQATEKALRRFTNDERVCAIGSAKAHIGHLEGAAGIAALIKTLLALRARRIPAMPKFERLNPFIKAGRSALFVNREAMDWPTAGHPRRAGISSFGFGGSFAHLVVEEHAPPPAVDPQSDQPALLVLSADSPEQLLTKARLLREFLATPAGEAASLHGLAYTLQAGRQAMAHRLAFVAESKPALAEILSRFAAGDSPLTEVWSGHAGHNRALIELFEDDAALRDAVTRYMSGTGDLEKIGRLWVQGFGLPGNHLYGDCPPRVVGGLPVHPFTKGIYWYKPMPDVTRDQAFESASAAATAAATADRLTEMHERTRRLELLAAEGVVAHLKPLGVLDRLTRGTSDLELVARDLGIAPGYLRFLHSVTAGLADQGFLAETPSGYEIDPAQAGRVEDLTPATFADRSDRFAREHEDLRPFVALLNTCVAQLGPCLRGEVRGTDVLFKGGATSLVEAIYRGNPVADHFNDKAIAFVHAYIEARLPTLRSGDKVTILEIGAGTGGGSARMLERLQAFEDRVEYIATDISPAFLKLIEHTFGARHRFLRTALFDLERPHPPALASAADLVFGANVLHATRNIGRSLDNVRACLKPGGALVLNELTRNQLFLTATFGLLDGWWLYDDEARRLPGGPLLSLARWREVLRAQGFPDARALDPDDNGQNIVIAQRGETPPLAGQDLPPPPPASGSVALQAILALVAEAVSASPERVDPTRPFLELGLDSLVSVELIARLNKKLGLALQTTDLLDHPTPARLAAHVEARSRFDRLAVRRELAADLKAERGLTSKTEIDKLFEVTGDSAEAISSDVALFEVLDRERVSAELIATAGGLKVEVVRAGATGPGLILLPPLNTLALVWHNQIEEFARDYRVLSIHYPGFGRSDFRSEGFDIPAIGRTIVEILGVLGVGEPYHLMGWSLGGLIAQSIAESEKSRVGTLTLVGTGTISMFDNDYYNDHTHIKQILDTEIAHEAVHPALKANHKLLVGTYNTEVLFRYAAEIRDFDHRCSRAVEAPVLVLNGEQDQVLLPKYARAMAQNFPVAAYREISGGGHFLPLTHPGRVNGHLRQFLRQGRAYLQEPDSPILDSPINDRSDR